MTKVFIIHGSYGDPNENWFPWLKERLGLDGHIVFVPKFSTPVNQSFDMWWDEFGPYYNNIDEDSILIGHSLGSAFILSVLESLELPKPIKACFSVSGFLGLLNNPKFDEINKTFTTKEFDLDKIKQNCERFFVYHSDNDPYVPIGCAHELAERLNVEVSVVKGAGHFNKESGYMKFEKLLEDLRSFL